MSMFTRNSEPAPHDPLKSNSKADSSAPPQLRRAEPSEAGKSVISNDLKIIGQGLKIISRGTLQVDGEVEGDVSGAEIIIGEQGKVTGTVAAERVIVRGRTSGVIRALTVALQASARVEGDIHHMSLAIEEGAEFDGNCRRPANSAELQPDLDTHSSSS
jgi:cytoskeletal protein CcmA (bactofilin family)